MSIEAMKQALEDICGARLCEVNSMSSRVEMLRLIDKAASALRFAIWQAEKQEPTGKEVELNIIRRWPDGFADRLERVWKDLIGFIPNYKLHDLQRTLAEYGFTMKVYDGAAPPAQRTTEESSAVAAQEPDNGDELTIAYMSGIHHGKKLAAQRQPLTEDDAPELTPSFFANARLTRPGENLLARKEPWGWLVPPYGDIQRNPNLKVTLPPAALAWRIPLYIGDKE